MANPSQWICVTSITPRREGWGDGWWAQQGGIPHFFEVKHLHLVHEPLMGKGNSFKEIIEEIGMGFCRWQAKCTHLGAWVCACIHRCVPWRWHVLIHRNWYFCFFHEVLLGLAVMGAHAKRDEEDLQQRWAFSGVAPSLRNGLLLEIHQDSSFPTFKKMLKTKLFKDTFKYIFSPR